MKAIGINAPMEYVSPRNGGVTPQMTVLMEVMKQTVAMVRQQDTIQLVLLADWSGLYFTL